MTAPWTEIQSIYGFDTIRIQTDLGTNALEGIPGIEEITDQGNHQEVRCSGDPQGLLETPRRPYTDHPFRGHPAVAARHLRAGSPRLSLHRSLHLHADLRKIWIVASTEFGSMIRTKSFLVGIMLLPVITGASVLDPAYRCQASRYPAAHDRRDRPHRRALSLSG